MKNEKITSRDVDFAKWYTDVVMAAHLASYTNVKGCDKEKLAKYLNKSLSEETVAGFSQLTETLIA